MKDDYDKYLDFFKNYGVNLKYGIYNSYGADKEKLQDLLVYKTINQEKHITLKKYVETERGTRSHLFCFSKR